MSRTLPGILITRGPAVSVADTSPASFPQGWNQYCSATGPGKNDYSKCHVNGGLCPWANATLANFTQTAYEQCMRANNVTQCQVEESVVTVSHSLSALTLISSLFFYLRKRVLKV